MTTTRPLTPKQLNFCYQYVLHSNGAQAYNIAYPGNRLPTTAAREAVKLRHDPRIYAEIERLREDHRIQNGIDLADIVAKTRAIISALESSAMKPRTDEEGAPIFMTTEDGSMIKGEDGLPIQEYIEVMTPEIAREIRANTELIAKLGGLLERNRLALPDNARFTFNMDYDGKDRKKIEQEETQTDTKIGDPDPSESTILDIKAEKL